jgi:hypothetical protein
MSRRARVAVVGLVLCAAASAAAQLVRALLEPSPGQRCPAIVAEYDTRRFAGLAEELPPGGVVGYVTNDPDSPDAIRAYYLAQYVLAPCVIVRGDEPDLVLVDDRPDGEGRPAVGGGRLRRDLGNGVRLYVREGPR